MADDEEEGRIKGKLGRVRPQKRPETAGTQHVGQDVIVAQFFC